MELEERTGYAEGEDYAGTRISTGSDYIDKALRGGIPLGSLTLVEGPSGSGKSVMCQHLAFGSLMADLLVAYFLSKGTVEDLVGNMSALGLDVSEDVSAEQLRIYPMGEIGDRRRDSRALLKSMLDHVSKRVEEGVDVVIVDDFASTLSRAGADDGVRFVSKCKTMSRRGLTLMFAIHTSAFDKELAWRFHRAFDTHVSLNLEGQKRGWEMEVVNLMELKKVDNLAPSGGSPIYFRVNPELGASMNISLDVLPIFKIRV